MIVTLAGHVDHGKTSLVRALTGVDTDSTAEEKARGLTIDLGFAYIDDANLGFVDVPGHHRFIHNMVAGVAAHQYALLVVAADDGPMPQTLEHLQILSLLGLKGGVIALTKTDMVDVERVQAVRAAIREITAGTFLATADIVTCSSHTGAGIDTLRDHLVAVGMHQQAHGAATTRAFRLPVDRAFNVHGSGTVVTGTTLTGRVSVDQTLTVFPGLKQTRVRGIRADHRKADRAGPGARTALNLAGVDISDVQRGSWLTSDVSAASSRLSVRLTLLADFPRSLRTWTPVHVYHATTHSTARLGLLDTATLAPGDSTLADLVCDLPLLACAGDRLLIRDQGLDRTLGGGVVIDNQPPPARRRQASRLKRLAALETTDVETAFANLLSLGPTNWTQLAALWGLPPNSPPPGVREEIIRVGEDLILASTWKQWQDTLLAAIDSALTADATRTGLRENELPGTIPSGFRGELLRQLVAAKRLAQTAGAYHPPRHSARLSSAQKLLLEKLTPLLDSRQPPSTGDLAKQMKRPLLQLAKELDGLAKAGAIVRISDNRFFLPAFVDDLAAAAADLGTRGAFTARDFRDAAAIGRNTAIDVLEFFDHVGFTRRQGDERRVFGTWTPRAQPDSTQKS
ncbi:MAG: selenocysteine-specific translation elongation factor [Pseudomonadales bacterium]|nr:selenocysteine-specific translation elongation factor [Pseudomonadales bacterium]